MVICVNLILDGESIDSREVAGQPVEWEKGGCLDGF